MESRKMGYYFGNETAFEYVKSFECENGDVITVRVEQRTNETYVAAGIERENAAGEYIGSVDFSNFDGNPAKTIANLTGEVWSFAKFAGTELTDESDTNATYEARFYRVQSIKD